ncbi:MAG: PilW family protein [bacterium]
MISEKGLTLLELIVVMVLVGILSSFVANMIFNEIDIYTYVISRSETLQKSRRALQMLSRDIRHIIAPDNIYQASEDSLRFEDVDNFMILYKYINNQMLRNGDALADSVQDFHFSYFDNSGNSLAVPVTNPSDISTIAINLTISNKGHSLNFSTKVKPRNF